MSGRFGVLHNKSFRALWLGEWVAELGGAAAGLCNGLLLYQLTGSTSALGMMWLVYFLPSLVIQLAAGPMIDRLPKKSIMAVSQFSRAVLFLVPAIWLMVSVYPVWMLYSVQFVLGCIQPFYVPAGMSLLPVIVKPSDLKAANAYLDGTLRLMGFLAPAAGGMIIASSNLEWAYAGAGVLFFLSFLSLRNIEEKTTVSVKKKSWFMQIKDGYRFFFGSQHIIGLTVLSGIVQFGVGTAMVINIPYVLEELKGTPFLYGLFAAGFPLGYTVGSALAGKYGPKNMYRASMLGGLLAGGLSFIGLALAESYYVALACEIAAGIFFPFFNIYNTTLLQKLIPEEVRGSVFSMRLLVIRAAMPLGIIFAGQLGEVAGIRGLYLIVGLLITASVFLCVWFPGFKKMDSPILFHNQQ